MKIAEFINGYKQLSNEAMKQTYVKGVLNVKYVPYEEKIKHAKKCLLEHFNEEGMVYQNTPMAYVKFVICILTLYTALEFDEKSPVEMYDALQAYALVEQMMKMLGDEAEVLEFNTVYDMCVMDFKTNTLSPRGFIQLQVAKLGENAQALAEYLSKLDIRPFMERFKKK